MMRFMIEPGDALLAPSAKKLLKNAALEEEQTRPDEIDNKTFWNIIGGALADNVGSTALFPLCLSPLALEAYYADFVARDEEPILSVVGYQWLSVCVALMVIPGTVITPYVFSKIGPSGGCVVGNVCTGILTIVLLLIGNAVRINALRRATHYLVASHVACYSPIHRVQPHWDSRSLWLQCMLDSR